MGLGQKNLTRVGLGQLFDAWVGLNTYESGKFPPKSSIFQKFSLRVKKISHNVWSKNTLVKGRLAPYLLLSSTLPFLKNI